MENGKYFVDKYFASQGSGRFKHSVLIYFAHTNNSYYTEHDDLHIR